jgi:putative LysE/RhtB family amino acid efflux pump
MTVELLSKGLVLGLAVAAPLGPIGALCISRALERGFAAGVAGGLGTALADGVYAALAALGFATFSSILATISLPLQLGGGAFMLWLGWNGLTPGPQRAAASISARDLGGTIAATFLLTIANPMTILSFAALFAGLGLATEADTASAALVSAGVFAGSLLWWCFLSGGVSLFRNRLPPGFSIWVSRISGATLIGFGAWAMGSALI